MGRAIFISYRRDDTEGEAGRLYDDLTRSFGSDSVFMDVAGINPGVDFRKAIDDNVATCGVLLAMIGPQWATITHPDGTRRLDDPNDFVRLEIAAALGRNIAVIPVLVHDSKMPHSEQLPDNLKDLAYRNSVELTHARWNSDVDWLTKALEPYIAAAGRPSDATVHATVPVQLPPANPATPVTPEPAVRRMAMLWISISIAVLVFGGGIFLFHSMQRNEEAASAKKAADTTTRASMAAAPAAQPSDPNPSAASPSNAAKAAASAAPIQPVASPFAGDWTNPAPLSGNSLSRLSITAQGGRLAIHAFGNCSAVECDWGTETAVVSGGRATASWQFGQTGRIAMLTVVVDGNDLAVTVANSYANHKPVMNRWNFRRSQ